MAFSADSKYLLTQTGKSPSEPPNENKSPRVASQLTVGAKRPTDQEEGRLSTGAFLHQPMLAGGGGNC